MNQVLVRYVKRIQGWGNDRNPNTRAAGLTASCWASQAHPNLRARRRRCVKVLASWGESWYGAASILGWRAPSLRHLPLQWQAGETPAPGPVHAAVHFKLGGTTEPQHQSGGDDTKALRFTSLPQAMDCAPGAKPARQTTSPVPRPARRNPLHATRSQILSATPSPCFDALFIHPV